MATDVAPRPSTSLKLVTKTFVELSLDKAFAVQPRIERKHLTTQSASASLPRAFDRVSSTRHSRSTSNHVVSRSFSSTLQSRASSTTATSHKSERVRPRPQTPGPVSEIPSLSLDGGQRTQDRPQSLLPSLSTQHGHVRKYSRSMSSSRLTPVSDLDPSGSMTARSAIFENVVVDLTVLQTPALPSTKLPPTKDAQDFESFTL